jgi:shikimate kinase
VLDPDNRHVLRRNGVIVWLRARVETLAQRVGDGAGRPLLGDDPEAALCRLYAQRRPLYQELAHVVVDVDRLDPVTIADRVQAALSSDARR